jgi:hypothetical protein
MILKWSSLIGGALLLFALYGVFSQPGSWVGWCDLIGAWFAFFIAAEISPNCSRMQRIASPMALSFGLFITSFVAFFTIEPRWLSWPTFGFACAFLILSGIRWIEKDKNSQPSNNLKERIIGLRHHMK